MPRLLIVSDSPETRAELSGRIQLLWPEASVSSSLLSAPLSQDDLDASALIVDCRGDQEAIMRILGEIELRGGPSRPHLVLLIGNLDQDKHWALAIGADNVLVMPFTDADLRLVFDVAGKATGLTLENRKLRHTLDALSQDAHRLRTLAYTDHLTGLPNRLYLTSWLTEVMARKDADLHFAVHLLDIDGFKQVNDRYGHRSGDQILRQVSDRVARISRRLDLVVRLGGDEIAIVQVGVDTAEDCEALLARIYTAFAAPFEIDQQRLVQIGASIGTAIYPGDGETLSDLLHHADTAMYRLKPGGTRRTRRMAESARDSNDRCLAERASYALAFGLRDGRLEGLLCDIDPAVHGAAPADPFRGLRIALAQAAWWAGDGAAAFFSAAIDPQALVGEAALSTLRDLMARARASPEQCEIRLPASGLGDRTEFWHQLRELGFRLAVEVDTASFSPQPLLRVPLTRLHLAPDIAVLDTSSKELRILLDMAVVFARAAGAATLAHGVSSAGQMKRLRGAGVDAVTGPFLGVALRGDALPAVRQRALRQE